MELVAPPPPREKDGKSVNVCLAACAIELVGWLVGTGPGARHSPIRHELQQREIFNNVLC